jgi:hypothetical protein
MRRRLTAGLVAVLAAMTLAACDNGDSGEGSGTPSTTPIATPTGSPFSVSVKGPELANAGDTISATVTNTGRLPDKYQFLPDPSNAATITPRTLALAPGQSAKITIAVQISPLTVHVQDASAGLLGSESDYSIGANA